MQVARTALRGRRHRNVPPLPDQKDHAKYLVEQRGAHYLLTVKGNQPTLRKQLAGLPWAEVPITHTKHDRGHGRVEKRTLKVVTVDDGILFPHAAQAIQVTRKIRKGTAANGAPKPCTPSPT